MKHYLLTVFTISLLFLSASTFGQSKGEMDRFDASMMSESPNVVKMFPNPSIDYIQIEIQNSTLVDPTLTLYNIIGNEIIVEIEEKKDNLFEIQVKDLPPGYYLIAIKDEQTFFGETYKFVKR